MKIHVLKLKLRKLHKYIGFTFSLFILHLTVTGMLLTYPETFDIEERSINNYYILKKYNMDTYKDVYKFEDNRNEIIVIKNNIYLNDKFVDKFKEDILGIVFSQSHLKLHVLTANAIAIYVFERINEETEIADIIALSNTYNFDKIGLYNKTSDIILNKNIEYYKINNSNSVQLTQLEGISSVDWSSTSSPSKKLAQKYLKLHQGNGVSVIRILTELHNGKFFGSIFTLILFISSISLIFLTLSSFIFSTNLFKNRKK